jgi:hypothetical protein
MPVHDWTHVSAGTFHDFRATRIIDLKRAERRTAEARDTIFLVGRADLVYNRPMKKSANGLLLDRILEPVCSALNEEAARKIFALKADRKTQARVAKLADKCNEGDLTPEERREYELYLTANHFIAILKAKSRILLACKGRPA